MTQGESMSAGVAARILLPHRHAAWLLVDAGVAVLFAGLVYAAVDESRSGGHYAGLGIMVMYALVALVSPVYLYLRLLPPVLSIGGNHRVREEIALAGIGGGAVLLRALAIPAGVPLVVSAVALGALGVCLSKAVGERNGNMAGIIALSAPGVVGLSVLMITAAQVLVIRCRGRSVGQAAVVVVLGVLAAYGAGFVTLMLVGPRAFALALLLMAVAVAWAAWRWRHAARVFSAEFGRD